MTLECTNVLLAIATFIAAITSIYVSGKRPFGKPLIVGKDVYIDNDKYKFIISIMNQSERPVKIKMVTFRSKDKKGQYIPQPSVGIDFNHEHNGMQPHIHEYSYIKRGGEWYLNGEKVNPYRPWDI